MLAIAAHLDIVGAFRDVVPHAFFEIQLRPQLIEIRSLQAGAVLHRAAVRSQFAQQQSQQRGFARPVGSDHADLVAALDQAGEILHQYAPIDGVIDLLRLDDTLAGSGGRAQFQATAAHAPAALGALPAHCLQGADPPFVAGAARLDALAYPGLFFRQPLVELGIGALFGIQQRLLALQIAVPVTGKIVQLAALQVEDAGRQALQEAAVVGDEQHCAAKAEHELFQPFDGGDIQVVGGLVQN